VGDSRAYLVHEGQIFRVTRDHSMVQELVDRGLLTPQQAAHHPDANRITRALGMAPEIEAELRPQPVHHVPGDAFVLCSDGLSDLVEDHEILAIVGSEPAAQAVGKLVDLANARGGHDNVTVLVLRAREAAAVAVTAVPPTVAQTTTVAPATIPAASNGPTVVDAPRVDRATEPAIPIGAIPPPPAPLPGTEPPPSTIVPSRRSRTSPAVVVGLALALLALVVMGLALLIHLDERGGKRNASAPLAIPAGDAASDAPTPLAPESVVVPTATASAPPIAPLEPSPSTTAHKP
jgi:protein phosphatase